MTRRWKMQVPEPVYLLAFNPFGDRLACASSTSVCIVLTKNKEAVSPEWKLTDKPIHLEFSPDGKWLLVVTAHNRLRVYRTGQTEPEPWLSDVHLTENGGWTHRWPPFAHGGLSLLTSPTKTSLLLWDLASRTVVHTQVANVADCIVRDPRSATVFVGGLRVLTPIPTAAFASRFAPGQRTPSPEPPAEWTGQ